MASRRWFVGVLVLCLLAAATTSWAYYPRPPYHGVRYGASPLIDCWDCHWFSQENAFNAYRVSPFVLGADLIPPAGKDVYSISYTGWTDLVNTSRTGICQVCHTLTKYWGANYDYQSPATEEHFRNENCLGCHPHWPHDETPDIPTDEPGLFEFGMVGPESHNTHLNDCKGPRLGGCTDCHLASDITKFKDGNPISTTTICNPCHSPDGPVDGVNNSVVGAKNNWSGTVDGVYTGTPRTQLKPGLEHWCDGCHDSGTSVVNGVQAPDVLGNNTTWGYNITGHGNPSEYVGCLGCHDAGCEHPQFTFPYQQYEHCDGIARTYDQAYGIYWYSNYMPGYRLKDSSSGVLPDLPDLNVPKMQSPYDFGSPNYTLCLSCHHDAGDLFDTGGILQTNFRNDRRHIANRQWNPNLHWAHLYAPPLSYGPLWDSDWDGNNAADSTPSCPACHNVHGSASPKMLRHGELVPTNPDLDFHWYDAYDLLTQVGSSTGSLNDSLWGSADIITGFTSNHLCSGCHGTGSDAYFRVPHEVLVPPGSPVPKPLVNALAWTSNTSDTPQTQFTRGSKVRVHVVYYVCPFDPPPPYNVIRRIKIGAWGIKKSSKAVGQLEGAYYYPPVGSTSPWDITVPSTAASGSQNIKVVIRSNNIGGFPYVETQIITIKIVP